MPHLPSSARSGVALIAVGDPGRDRTVYATILLLVALGFALIMLAAWLLRNTRPDPDVLAPLERMGERKWRRADPVWQRRHLDEVRPGGAEPLEPSSAPPAADAEFELGPQASGFDDLVPSSTAPDDAAAGLSAPSPDAVPVDAPDAPGYDGDVAEGGTDAADDDEDGDGERGGRDGSDESDEDEEDDDDTGEQDTDDFFAVLDSSPDLDPDLATDSDDDHADDDLVDDDLVDDDRADEEGVPG
ncbi:MAG: hypothetical protein ACRDZZ_09845 [Ilumatobacteraceae bacterium]